MRRIVFGLVGLLAVGCISSGGGSGTDPATTDLGPVADGGPDAAPAGCVAGRTESCACAGGLVGVQTCGDDGRFGECRCGPEADAGPGADARVPPDAAVPCDPGATEDRPCGLNDRGTQTRACDGQVFGAWSECVDPDVCLDAAQEGRPCGLNGNGVELRSCIAGQWGDYGACDDPAECVDGAVEQRPCGVNGNGRETRTCDGGTFTPFGACEGDPDECLEGTIDTEACGVNGLGMRSRECRDGRLSQFGPCDDPDRACEDGGVETLPCGLNRRGQQAHTCVDGHYGPFTVCADPDDCVDAAVRQEVCGLNARGLQRQTCEAGHFGPLGACEDPDQCVDGSQSVEVCGLNGRGVQRATCVGGRLGALSACDDPDVCTDGAVEAAAAPCGFNDRGTQTRTCTVGQWSPFSDCVDPDECVDGSREVDPCGAENAGQRSRACADGRYGEYSACVGAEECPDAENPRCGPPQPERCNGLDDDQDGLVDEDLGGGGVAVPAPGAFEQDVNAAIDAGLQFIRAEEAGTGTYFDEQHNFLGVLAFLERRVGHPSLGPVGGFSALDGDDQAMIERMLRFAIDNDPALLNPAGRPYTYSTGGNLMALAAYLGTGGPEDVGALVGASQALANGVAALQRIQGQGASAWGYNAAGPDLSTTHFAANGLAAAEALLPGAAATLDRLPQMLLGNTFPIDGGLAYNPGQASSSSMTFAGLWLYALAGVGALDPGVQGALTWAEENYRPDRAVGGSFVDTTTYYSQWAFVKAMTALGPDAPDFATLDPAMTGYPDAEASNDFDIAATLLPWQDANGAFGTRFGGSPGGWTPGSSHAFALLALERSTGGVRTFESGGPAGGDACSNGVDDDGDGRVDFPADPECVFVCTPSEAPRAACSNDLDDDQDGRSDFPDDPGCVAHIDDSEADPDCSDRRDNDADGRTDYPADPGCANEVDTHEADPAQLPACADGRDNDADGLIDFPGDPQCYGAGQDEEGGALVCPMGVLAEAVPAAGEVRGSNVGALNVLRGSCGGIRGRERIYALVVDRPQRVTLSTVSDGTTFDTVLYVLNACQPGAAEIACSQAISAQDPLSEVTHDFLHAGVYFVVVDAQIGEGDFVLTVSRTPLPAACGDNRDNDADGAVDMLDDGCTSVLDGDESDQVAPPVCFNGVDDDGDGFTDFPAEPGCEGPGDDDETDPRVPTTCNDRVDNDQDGATDYPDDPSCAGRGRDSEFAPNATCGNGRDDDADGFPDYPLDPGCEFPADLTEENDDGVAAACANHIDDDRDGLVDFPTDPGCEGRGDASEVDPAARPVCANGRDDDADGAADWPNDPGCQGAGDRSEVDPARAPTCADGRDNDADGETDYPADPGCESAADLSEADDGALPLCTNGVDDDGDGRTDGNDLGCDGTPTDDDETDAAQVPACADGRDNDADGDVDFPGDDGCAANGDPCEQPGYSLCGGRCVDTQTDAANCGRCGRACGAGVQCIEGTCGGLYTFEGVGQNIAEADLEGWTVCHRDTYASTTPMAGFLAACDGEFVMYGCRQVGSPTFSLLAMGDRATVFADTGDVGNAVNTTNGVSFYFSQRFSLGFVPQGELPNRNSCDTGAGRGEERMCWHTGGGSLQSGYRCGAEFINNNGGWERVIFTSP
jgi:hypothetical protein